MIGGKADDGIIGNARILQLLHQVFQGIFQLQIGGDITLYRLGGIRVGGLGHFSVLGGHGIRAPAPVGVTADGHVIGVERRFVFDIIVDVVRNRQFHHLQIRVGPVLPIDGQIQTIAQSVEIITQIGMSQISIVVRVGIVVVGQGRISQRPELVAQCKRHVVVGADIKAQVVIDPGGDDAGHGGKFTAGGGLSPAGLVIIVENKTFVGQLIEGRRQFLTDYIGTKGFRSDLDQILARKHAGVFIFPAGSDAAEILIHLLHGLLIGQRGSSGKIQIHLVVA